MHSNEEITLNIDNDPCSWIMNHTIIIRHVFENDVEYFRISQQSHVVVVIDRNF